MPNVPSNATAIDLCTRRLTALARYVDPSTTIWIDGTEHTLAEVMAIYQADLDARAAIATKRAEIAAAAAERDRHEALRTAADRALRPWVRARFGEKSQPAIDFGFPPPRIGIKSLEVKQRAIARAAATRAARHTMGPRQREAIRGELPPATPRTDHDAPAG